MQIRVTGKQLGLLVGGILLLQVSGLGTYIDSEYYWSKHSCGTASADPICGPLLVQIVVLGGLGLVAVGAIMFGVIRIRRNSPTQDEVFPAEAQ